MERYTVVPLRSCRFGENGCYGVRIGGQGGRIVGDGMRLDSYQTDCLEARRK